MGPYGPNKEFEMDNVNDKISEFDLIDEPLMTQEESEDYEAWLDRLAYEKYMEAQNIYDLERDIRDEIRDDHKDWS